MFRTNALTTLTCLIAVIAQAAAQESTASNRQPAAMKPTDSGQTFEDAQPRGTEPNPEDADNADDEPQGKRQPDPTAGKIVRYAENLIRKHDANGNGVLDEQEWRGVGGNPLEADLNQDGTITPQELIHRIVVYGRHRSLRLVHPGVQRSGGLVARDTPGSLEPGVEGTTPADASAETGNDGSLAGAQEGSPSSAAGAEAKAEKAREQARRSRKFFIPREKLPAGIASWFIDRDADGDGQITMREFSDKWSTDVAAQFSSYDRNRDGVITAAESVSGGPKTNSAEPAEATSANTPPPKLAQ